jgi:hypothetical protein
MNETLTVLARLGGLVAQTATWDFLNTKQDIYYYY